ncbi:aminoglycoside 3'-phosphotransferase [Rhodococcus sp. IEGM 1401]|uniref:aminoglycoside 3'-phosphotransferase n=1 Tax=unclassified Rhodococcus (in: high G+C Gram-positive bacteria) TaxID=192944 RepID=UPI0022B39BCA|nr:MULTISPECIES: aminoglycoside 3'-phosphotransferase [unclassified Rhodococcus (in: high G+C Gram-positive bacteria)]MCZ4562127.1 aminoglycoside 3'-phosphotransferase [Rhodococcus sp. IEGM 1401]MDI9922157.1 aminoglycoside 3'-phosphotransferase [Rhodococcus sp. IEGM 1372]MDV8034709.1 aminoglycoside 3'-phosphotransferase [Rhodococcus sp. IEGM 1414]
MSVPDGDVLIPTVVRELAGPEDVEPVWSNELGGLTFRLGEARYVKWAPAETSIDLEEEARRLKWVIRYSPVPKVLESGSDGSGSWMMTEALPWENAVADSWFADPARAVRAAATGLRAFHDAVPVAQCPFDWSVRTRVGDRGLPVDSPPIDKLVVCHGDACMPNTLIADDGSWAAHVDMGTMGVADRWADLAPAIWSTEYNYGRDFSATFLSAYGVDLDRERLDYYLWLWEST